MELRVRVIVLGAVVVELFLERDLARWRRFRLVVTQHRHLDLTPLHGDLDQRFAIVPERLLQRLVQVFARAGLGGADAGAAVGGLNEGRVGDGGLNLAGDGGRIVAPAGGEDDDVLWHREAVLAEDHLLKRLVHSQGAGGHARAHIRHPRQLQEPLQGAVLAVGAVDEGEDRVQAAQGAQGLGAVQDALSQRLLKGCELLQAYGGEGALAIGRGEPCPLSGDADGHGLETVRVQGGHHRLGGDHGDLVLGGAAAEQDADLQTLACHQGSPAIATSFSSSMPKRSRTRERASSIRARASTALAPPRLRKKLVCC